MHADFHYLDGYYNGNVDQITLFFNVESVKEKTTFTAVNNNLNRTIIQVMDEKDIIFKTSQNKKLFRVKNKGKFFNELATNNYKDENNCYYLNADKKRLDTLNIYELFNYKNDLVSIIETKESRCHILYSNKNEPLTSLKYLRIQEYDNILIGTKKDKLYIIDKLGKETLLKDVVNVRNVMILISNSQGLEGYLNTKDEVIIPMIYNQVNSFNEGLVHVKKYRRISWIY